MKYSKRSQIFVFIGVPLVVLGQGLQIYFTNVDGNGPASEVSFVTAKTLVGVGRAFYQTAAQVSIQALVPREDVAVVTGVYFAAMNFGGAIGTRYVVDLLAMNTSPPRSLPMEEDSYFLARLVIIG